MSSTWQRNLLSAPSVKNTPTLLITRCIYGQSADADFLRSDVISSLYVPCDHRHGTSTLSPADVKAAPGGPCGQEAQHLPCPVVTVGKYKPRTRLAGCWPLQPHRDHRAQRNKSRQRGRLYSSQKPGEKKEHFLLLHPRWLASFPPPPSLQQTNIAEDKLLCSHDDDSQVSKREFTFKIPCRKISEHSLVQTSMSCTLTLSTSRTHTAPAAVEGQCSEVQAAHLSTADTNRNICRLWSCC